MYKLCKKRGQKITILATFQTIEEAREALITATGSKKRTGLFIQYAEQDHWINDFLVFENI